MPNPESSPVSPSNDSNGSIYHKPHFTQTVHGRASSMLGRGSIASDSTQLSTQRHRASISAPIPELEKRVSEWRAAYLAVGIEEVSEWLQRVAGNVKLASYASTQPRREVLQIESDEKRKREEALKSGDETQSPSILFDALQTGVLLCELAMVIQPSLTLRIKRNAVPGTFLARDNVESFIKVALSWGVPRSQIFEVDDLICRRHDRIIVNSLLDITRVVYIKFNVSPPQLVQYELEIEQIEKQEPEVVLDPILVPEPEPLPDSREPVPLPAPIVISKPRRPRYLPYISDPNDLLDVAVGNMVNKYKLDLLVKRFKAKQYLIGEEKVNHLRLVRNLVLVKVGGGWEAFVPFASRKFLVTQEDDS